MKALLRFLLLCLLLAAGAARADGCTATLSDVQFTAVSPITGSDVTASASGTVSCNWNLLSATPPFVLLFPKAVVCVNIGVGSNSTGANPRTLGQGANRLDYNLYRDNSYAASSIAGAPGVSGALTPLTLNLTAPNILTGGVFSAPFTVYGKITAGAALAAVPTAGNGDTVYSSSFAGAATISYAFYNLFAPACTAGASSSFSFQVQATVINDCTVSASPISFANGGVLSSAVRATGSLSVRCVNNNAYQIALNGGSVSGNVAARQMQRFGGSERLNYDLSATLDGPGWGDGSGATAKVGGTGSGQTSVLTIYARVPAQAAPVPGDYKDTVTATIYF